MTQAMTPYIRIGEAVYCSMDLLVELGIKYITIEMGYTRKSSHWQSIKDPQDNRRRLIAYAPMKEKYKQLVKAKYGDPYEAVRIQFFEQQLCYDELDSKIIDSFRTAKLEQLSLAKRKAYKKAAALLAYLANLPRLTKSILKKMGFENAKVFWKAVYQYVLSQDIKLPASPRLKTKVKEYKEQGVEVLIHDGYNNTNSKKLNDKATMILVKLMRDIQGRKFSKKEVWRQFKAVAKQNKLGAELENITYQCAWYHIKATESLWFSAKHGDKQFMARREIRINKNKPSQPHLQWQIDGTPAPLWYYCEKAKTVKKLYTIVLMDSYSDAIVGYSIGATETMNGVFEALKMAAKVQGVVPHVLRSDKGSANTGGETQELLHNLNITFIASKAGNPKSRTIEGNQGVWMRTALDYYANKSGLNITTKDLDNAQNPEIVKKMYKSYPNKSELVGQIQESIALYNNWKIEGKRTRAERLADEAPDARAIDWYEMLDNFYVFRKRGKTYRPYRLTPEGITMEVGKKQYRYMINGNVEEQAAFVNTHLNLTKFYIKYDPSDLEQVALYVLPTDAVEETAQHFRFIGWASIKGKSNELIQYGTDEEKANYQHMMQLKAAQREQAAEQIQDHDTYLSAHEILTQGISLEDVRKEDYNAAKVELQRLNALGYGHTTLNEEQEQYLEVDIPVQLEEEEVDIYDSDFDISSLLNN